MAATSATSTVRFDEQTGIYLQPADGAVDREDVPDGCDLVIVLGGDGTLLAAARAIGRTRDPAVPCESRRTSAFSPPSPWTSCIPELERALRGEYRVAGAACCTASCTGGRTCIGRVRSAERRRAHEGVARPHDRAGDPRGSALRLHVSGGRPHHLHADGVDGLLALGGRADHVSRVSRALLITPICPHMLTNRPVLVPDDSVIQIISRAASDTAYLTIDGQVGEPLRARGSRRVPAVGEVRASDPAAADDVLRCAARKAELGRAMKRLSLTAWIFIGMAAGIALGVLAPGCRVQLAPVSNVFLRLIKSIIAPLLFGTLVAGIAGTRQCEARWAASALKAIVYFEIVTTHRAVPRTGAVNLVRPGEGMRLERTAAEADAAESRDQLRRDPGAHLPGQHHRRDGARRRAADCRLLVPVRRGLCGCRERRRSRLSTSARSLAEVMFRYTKYVMYLAPFGVGAAMAVTVGSKGIGVLFGLGKLIATMYVAQVLFVVVVLGA